MKLGAFLFEVLPLLGFFIGYSVYGLFAAAMISVGLGALVLFVAWFQERRVARFPLFSLLLSAGFTWAAIALDADIFIKMQPTLFNGLFAVVLLGGLIMRRAMMREFFQHQFALDDATWFTLSLRWGLFFLGLALANEYVWRGFDEAEWVFYKTFIAAPASALFMLAQLPITLRGLARVREDSSNQ
jgi:intracellular septation protein